MLDIDDLIKNLKSICKELVFHEEEKKIEKKWENDDSILPFWCDD